MSNLLEQVEFKPIDLSDRAVIHERLQAYQPCVSELTFTNLFIWHGHYRFEWTIYRDWLLIVAHDLNGAPFALQPVGPAPRAEVTWSLLDWLHVRGCTHPRIERADERLIAEVQEVGGLLVEPTREQFDYVYNTESLIELSGRKLHAKRNHINQFQRQYDYRLAPLQANYVAQCMDLAGFWCELRRCDQDMNLLDEWEAVHKALAHWQELHLQGQVILVDGQVQAFSLGELLNPEMAVIHLEKANPEIPGLYAVINQQFCEHAWAGTRYVNREQDLGQEGLRQAKMSYHPDHLVAKYRVRFQPGDQDG